MKTSAILTHQLDASDTGLLQRLLLAESCRLQELALTAPDAERFGIHQERACCSDIWEALEIEGPHDPQKARFLLLRTS